MPTSAQVGAEQMGVGHVGLVAHGEFAFGPWAKATSSLSRVHQPGVHA